MRKGWIISGVVGLGIGVVGIAGASVIANDGMAKATGTIGTLQAVTGKGSINGDIWPGHSNSCTITITNPNSVDVLLDSLTPQEVLVVDAGGSPVGPGDGTAGVGAYSPATYSTQGAHTATLSPTDIVIGANSSGSFTAPNCISLDQSVDTTSLQGGSVAIHYSVAFESH